MAFSFSRSWTSASAHRAALTVSVSWLTGAPNIPTVDEAGLEGFYQSNWHALFAPKGTPKEIIGKLNAAAVTALADPQIRDRLVADGQDLFPPDELTPEALAAFQQREIAQRWPIVKAAGIKSE